MKAFRPPLTYIPGSITNRAMIVYVLALLTVNLIFMGNSMDIMWWAWGLVEVITFFLLANIWTKKWSWEHRSEKWFAKTIFTTAFAMRLAYVLFTYWFYIKFTGKAWEHHAADVLFYHEVAQNGAKWLMGGDINLFDMLRAQYGYGSGLRYTISFSDTGFPLYLSLVYFISGNTEFSILFQRILNSVWSAWTVLLIYRIAQRHFGESTARIAAILCLLMPNLFFYCGTGLKETLMVFLAVLFTERSDKLLQGGKFVFGPTMGIVAIAFYLFMIRTALAATLVLALLCALLLSSSRVVGWGRRMGLIAIVGLFGGLMLLQNTSIMSDVQSMAQQRGSGQKANMEWRSTRKDKSGRTQKFAKKAGAAVFAPLIFTLPFPTMVSIEGQEGQMMLNGGYFCKNITSFFTIMAMIMLLFSGDWRKHVLPAAILCGYLVVLIFSPFAQSERFHLPTIPFAMLFAAYAISRMKEKKKYSSYYAIWAIAMLVAAIGWNWFKLKGRGMI